MAPRLRFLTTRSGHVSVEVEGCPYHSLYDPYREARKFYAAEPIEKADVVLHFGWGLGYSGEVLRERLRPSAHVLVFEPDEELFKLSSDRPESHNVLQDRRFKFVVGSQSCQFFDEWGFDACQETDEFLWLTWPAAYKIHGILADKLRENFKIRLRDRAASLLTHLNNGRLYFDNVLANLPYQNDPDAGHLFGNFKNVPLVIVSAGPSLDRNIRELRGKESRCLILAVDTALRPLLSAGVVPHAVVMADPTEARHVAGAVPESTYLIAEQAVHTSALRSASRRFLFGLGLFPDALFRKFGLGKSPLQVDIRFPGRPAERLPIALEQGVSAISHLADVLRSRSRSCGCLDAYLELTAKEAILRGNQAAINESILSGRRACEEICRTHAEGRAAFAH